MGLSVDVNTRLVGLLGHPLGHSFSPMMQNAAFEKLGLNYLYLPIEVTDEHLKDVVTGLSRMNFAGYNITIPHKVRIMEYIDRIDDLARIIGAVNVVSLKNGVSTGYNTDGEGFVRSLQAGTGESVKDKVFFVMGSGGAARAIGVTLAFRGAKEILICNRTAQKAHVLADEINTRVRPCSEVVPMDNEKMRLAVRHADILVNTTSVGMHPNENELPVSRECLHGSLTVADIVYNPRRTMLLQAAKDIGSKVIDGLGMLVYQGAEAFRIWTGVEPPVDVMFDAVLSGSHRP